MAIRITIQGNAIKITFSEWFAILLDFVFLSILYILMYLKKIQLLA